MNEITQFIVSIIGHYYAIQRRPYNLQLKNSNKQTD